MKRLMLHQIDLIHGRNYCQGGDGISRIGDGIGDGVRDGDGDREGGGEGNGDGACRGDEVGESGGD